VTELDISTSSDYSEVGPSLLLPTSQGTPGMIEGRPSCCEEFRPSPDYSEVGPSLLPAGIDVCFELTAMDKSVSTLEVIRISPNRHAP
jgi:hypothetical protein